MVVVVMNDLNLFAVEGSVCLKSVRSKVEVSGGCDGYLIDASEKEARRIIESLRANGGGKTPLDSKHRTGRKERLLIGVVGGDDAFNRRVVESLRVDYLVSPERGDKVDSLKQRDSGINHVVAKIAKEKGVVIIVDFGEVAGLKGKARALRIGRLIQNVKICRKVGCKLKIASLGSGKKDVVDELARKAFGFGLGMSSAQVADAVRF